MSEQEYKEMIYKKAAEVKDHEGLIALLKEIESFKHDYGTIVYGCMAAMKAAFNVVNRSPTGGITGFQAGCMGWECVREFMYIKGPAKLMDFENMLYPQYEHKFEKTITKDTWKDLRLKAEKNISETKVAHQKVIAHWKSIVAGNVPFGYSVTEED